jgi:protein SCO1/2
MRTTFAIAALSCPFAGLTRTARGERMEPAPAALQDVGVTEHLDAVLPLDLGFVDENGKAVTLRQYFGGDRPVLLTLNYYRCPMLCTLQLNGLVEGLANMPWTPGDQFEIVTVSIDPKETPQLARLKKQNYMADYGRPQAAPGWHFLTSPQEQSVARLAEAVGFRYAYDAETDQYAHAAAAMVCTPDGRMSRYLYGIEYHPQTLKLSLLEAGEGKIGSTFDQMLLFCYHYDAGRGRYAPAAMNIMRAGGAVTVMVLGAVLLTYWLRESRRRRAAAVQEAHS